MNMTGFRGGGFAISIFIVGRNNTILGRFLQNLRIELLIFRSCQSVKVTFSGDKTSFKMLTNRESLKMNSGVPESQNHRHI